MNESLAINSARKAQADLTKQMDAIRVGIAQLATEPGSNPVVKLRVDSELAESKGVPRFLTHLQETVLHREITAEVRTKLNEEIALLVERAQRWYGLALAFSEESSPTALLEELEKLETVLTVASGIIEALEARTLRAEDILQAAELSEVLEPFSIERALLEELARSSESEVTATSESDRPALSHKYLSQIIQESPGISRARLVARLVSEGFTRISPIHRIITTMVNQPESKVYPGMTLIEEEGQLYFTEVSLAETDPKEVLEESLDADEILVEAPHATKAQPVSRDTFFLALQAASAREEKLTVAELAEKLGISTKAVRSQLARLRDNLASETPVKWHLVSEAIPESSSRAHRFYLAEVVSEETGADPGVAEETAVVDVTDSDEAGDDLGEDEELVAEGELITVDEPTTKDELATEEDSTAKATPVADGENLGKSVLKSDDEEETSQSRLPQSEQTGRIERSAIFEHKISRDVIHEVTAEVVRKLQERDRSFFSAPPAHIFNWFQKLTRDFTLSQLATYANISQPPLNPKETWRLNPTELALLLLTNRLQEQMTTLESHEQKSLKRYLDDQLTASR